MVRYMDNNSLHYDNYDNKHYYTTLHFLLNLTENCLFCWIRCKIILEQKGVHLFPINDLTSLKEINNKPCLRHGHKVRSHEHTSYPLDSEQLLSKRRSHGRLRIWEVYCSIFQHWNTRNELQAVRVRGILGLYEHCANYMCEKK